MSRSPKCAYVRRDGSHCELEPSLGALCRWHDPEQGKLGQALTNELQALIDVGHSPEGMKLRGVDLRGINLTGNRTTASFCDTDLTKAKLDGAHLYAVDMRGASLLKACLRGANLNEANLEGADLLGTEFDRARIEQIRWGHFIVQERRAEAAAHAGDREESWVQYREAEEVYRQLRRVSEDRGHFENAGRFFHHEMIMRRRHTPRNSLQHWVSKFVDLTCGYGEKPMRLVLSSALFIAAFAVIYGFIGIVDGGQLVQFALADGLMANLERFSTCLYFSVVTFTTLGYGDVVPLGIARAIAAFEAFSGAFTIALFVVVFIKRMTR